MNEGNNYFFFSNRRTKSTILWMEWSIWWSLCLSAMWLGYYFFALQRIGHTSIPRKLNARRCVHQNYDYLLFIAGDRHAIMALDLKTGALRWLSYHAWFRESVACSHIIRKFGRTSTVVPAKNNDFNLSFIDLQASNKDMMK